MNALQLHITAHLYAIVACAEYNLGSLDNTLHYYETLHHTDIQHRFSKRSITGTKHITFSALGRDFKLFLQNRKGLLSSQFHAVSVDKHGNERPYAVDETTFYTGYDEDESHSVVKAYWEGHALFATIRTPKDVYMVEPSWRHLPESNNYSMIAYKGSDVKTKFDKEHPDHKGPSFCGSAAQETDASNASRISHDDKLSAYEDKMENENRVKRATFDQNKKSCSLLVVGDFRFFSNMGQSNIAYATHYLVGLIDRVDAIFRGTEFEPGLKGFGFEIKEVKVHTDWSNIPQGEIDHYNMESVGWRTEDLLKAFSRTWYNGQFCLAHLFTHWSFSSGTLGLANIASNFKYAPGGICDKGSVENSYPLYPKNTAWSSSLNGAGNRLLISEADLVTTHGHNWGSEHDPDTEECSPSTGDGGKHLMYTYSVSGYERNNKVFSNCSRRLITQVLKAKSSACFQEVSLTKGFCGNNRVEEGEDCDAGLHGQENKDPCCTLQCKFKSAAKCSDSNDNCCLNCDFAPTSAICYKSAATDLTCQGDSNCDGTSAKCPDPPPKPDFTDCFDNGTCQNGVCLTFCESNGKEPCICDSVEQSCLFCCRDDAQSKCIPYASQNSTQPYVFLPDGKPCVQGFCNNTGVCEKKVVNLVQRFWNVIRDISFSDAVAFMRANIVITIITLSLLIWIPAGCVINRVDRKKRLAEKVMLKWLKPGNADLHPVENTHVSHVENTRHRPVIDLHHPEMTSTEV